MYGLISAFTDFFTGLGQAGGAVLNAVQTVAACNYKVVTAVFQSLNDGGKALVTISSRLASALLDILYYIGDFLVEVIQVVYVILRLVGKFTLLVYHVCAVCFQGLALMLVWIAESCAEVVRGLACGAGWCGGYVASAWLSIKECLGIVGTETAKYASVVGEKTLAVASETAYVTSSYTSDFAQSLKDYVSRIHKAIVQNISHSLAFVTETLTNTCHQISSILSEIVVSEVYVYIIVATLIVLLLRFMLQHLHRKGMTFPLLRLRQDDMELPQDLYYNTDMSDEEDSQSDESEEEEDVPEATVLVEESDEENVEEYEVVSESEEEDEDDSSEDEPVNVQLPMRVGRYNLRTRATPSPVPQPGLKRSPDELEKVLENERDKRMCVVCQDQVKNVLVMPCRHMCLCVDCAHEIARSRNPARRVCPLCRSRIETVMDVFI